jgi:hypothetical protein
MGPAGGPPTGAPIMHRAEDPRAKDLSEVQKAVLVEIDRKYRPFQMNSTLRFDISAGDQTLNLDLK